MKDESIFISYSHEDKATVDSIVETIQRVTDMEVWYDPNLRGGALYFSVIADQIAGCKYFVFIVSEDSVRSDWCLRELEFAASEQKAIIAIWLKQMDVSPRVRLVIQNTQYINYYAASEKRFEEAVQRTFNENTERETTQRVREDNRTEQAWGDTYFLRSDELSRISWLLDDERQGHCATCFEPENALLLGLAYELGIDVDKNPRRAAFYYKVSAHRGNYDGKFLYAAIRSRQQGADIAALLTDKIDAAEHGSVYALTYLGDDYYEGHNGCDRDQDKAYSYWMQAADRGGVYAMYSMAYGYRWGEGVPKDPELAYMYALMAKEYDFPRAFRIIGFMYRDGDCVDKDEKRAISLFEQAIKRGDYLSLCYEGLIYDLKEDYDKAIALYERAVQLADEGRITSGLPYYRIGVLYKNGEGVTQDLNQAVQYYLKAAARNHHNAKKYVVGIIDDMRDQETKETYLHKAYELDCDGAAYTLGEIARKAAPDREDLPEEAISYYAEGAERGDSCSVLCVIQLIENYALTFRTTTSEAEQVRTFRREHADYRDEAIKWYEFLFARSDDEAVKGRIGNDGFAVFYIGYAMELDYNPGGEASDQELVRYYVKKAFDLSTGMLHELVNYYVNDFLYPQETLDVEHAAEMLGMLENYLGDYWRYIVSEGKESYADRATVESSWKRLRDTYVSGYQRIAECYERGDGVVKDPVIAEQYREQVHIIQERMDAIVAVGGAGIVPGDTENNCMSILAAENAQDKQDPLAASVLKYSVNEDDNLTNRMDNRSLKELRN